MTNNMNKKYKFSALWMMCLMLFSYMSFTACDNGDDEDTNQYKGGINLNVLVLARLLVVANSVFG